MTITWDEKYSLPFDPINEQHKKLLGVINELHAALHGGASKEEWLHIKDALNKYTWQHFKTEELLMLKHEYADYAEHKKVHDVFRSRVERYNEEIELNYPEAADDMLVFLVNWWKEHIPAIDSKMTVFLSSKNVL